ncbi:MAG: gamma-D-glutamyl-L-lysine dipeptidyl-peptidase [Carnobacterium sp.]|uniref:C40 family peptidase n=1 Tax=Carnobacterium sp. TaxID=48221 RepID=UPI002649B5F9|nr:C40 family peptidase [Carnobacterium sp.]MDN5371905.1 gamma-D-glutamyl-L-lysine dipeptidyl-peptidase [Carnobacterium sp.]
MKKMVNVTTTFLWSKNLEHPVQEKIREQDRKEHFYTLTDEEAMNLYKDRLVDSELLYGDIVEVLKTSGEYAQVTVIKQAYKNEPKGYPGWIFNKDLAPIPDGWLEELDQIAVKQPIAKINIIKDNQSSQMDLSIGTILSVLEETTDEYKVLTPAGIGIIGKRDAHLLSDLPLNAVDQLINNAKSFLDLRYVWAGTSAAGFDCSGFVYTLFRTFNIWLSRDAQEQVFEGEAHSYEEAKPGDLLFFAYQEGYGEVHHVGIYLGEDQMIHSQTPGSKVMITKLEGTNYQKELCAVRRFFN